LVFHRQIKTDEHNNLQIKFALLAFVPEVKLGPRLPPAQDLRLLNYVDGKAKVSKNNPKLFYQLGYDFLLDT
jgi:hypothetical protein